VNPGICDSVSDDLIEQRGENRSQNRADHPAQNNRFERAVIDQGTRKKVPADDRPDNGLRRRNGIAQDRQPIDRDRGGQCNDKGARNGIHGTEFPQRPCGTRPTDDRPEDHEDPGEDRSLFEADHPCPDGGSKNVRRIVGAQ